MALVIIAFIENYSELLFSPLLEIILAIGISTWVFSEFTQVIFFGVLCLKHVLGLRLL